MLQCSNNMLQMSTAVYNKFKQQTSSHSLANDFSQHCCIKFRPVHSPWLRMVGTARGADRKTTELMTTQGFSATVSHFASLDHDLHNQLVSTSAPKACWLHEILPPRSNAEAPLCGCKPSGEWSPCTCERKIPQGHTDDTVAWCWQCSLCSSRHVVAQINRLLVIRQQDSATHD